jgi:hypothetical protein
MREGARAQCPKNQHSEKQHLLCTHRFAAMRACKFLHHFDKGRVLRGRPAKFALTFLCIQRCHHQRDGDALC